VYALKVRMQFFDCHVLLNFMIVMPLKHKSDALETFKESKAMVERQNGKKI
jgi:hypothetical protein